MRPAGKTWLATILNIKTYTKQMYLKKCNFFFPALN